MCLTPLHSYSTKKDLTYAFDRGTGGKKRKNIFKKSSPYQVHISSPYQMLKCSGWSSDTENQKLVAARDPNLQYDAGQV